MHQDKKAIAADSWYLLHSPPQNEGPASVSMKSATLAVEEAAASDRNDSTQSPTTMINIIPTWWVIGLTKTANASTMASVKLHGITKPLIVTKKQKAV